MPVNQFQSGAATIQFTKSPTRAGGETPELFQVSGFDSLGTQYVYEKGRIFRISYSLTYHPVSDALLTALKAFLSTTVRGNKTPFTWYDHDGVAHTVRQIGKLEVNPTGPDRYSIRIDLEEDTALSAPPDNSYSSRYAAPVWILKLTINAVAYYLSESTVTVSAWGITTKPWVLAWGKIQEGITNGLAEFRVSDLSVELLTDPDANPNMETLATSYPLEKSPAELYLWFAGSGNAPQMVFRGYVRDIDIPDETGVSIVIEDESSRLQSYVGTKVDRTTYPSADPDDVGKVIPIIFGTVNKLPALAVDAGIMTSLPNGITAAATSITVSDATGLTAGMTLQVDDEQILIGAVSGDSLTSCTRGYNATVASIHQKGAQLWQIKSQFVYLVADHAVDSIGKIYGKVADTLLDITAVCTKYAAGNHGSYPGKAVITVPGYITVQQAIDLMIADGISVTNGTLDALLSGSVSKSGTVTLSGAIAKSGTAALGGSVTESAHPHGESYSNISESTTNTPLQNSGTTSGYQTRSCIGVFNNSASGNRAAITLSINARFSCSFTYDWAIWLCDDSNNRIHAVAAVNGQSGARQCNYTIDVPSDHLTLNRIEAVIGSSNVFINVELDGASRTIRLSSTSTGNATAGVSNGSLGVSDGISVNNGTLANSDGIGISNTLDAGLSGNVTKTGTVTLSGNSVANTLVCDSLLVNVVRSFASPAAAMQSLLISAGSSLQLSQSGALPGTYALNGAITEYRKAMEWLSLMAFQLRSWFRVELGTAKLIVRPDTFTPSKTIAACRISADGKKIFRRRKAELADVVNKIDVLFDRDWSASGAEAYRQVSKGSNAASITDFGTHEQPDLFQCDFIIGSTMADSIRDFYLSWSGKRPWLIEFESFLDQLDLKFGDVVTLGFAGNAVGQIIEAGPAPGDTGRIDTIKFTVAI